jgi:hypothetical protein
VVTLETAVSGGMGCFVICQKHIDILQKPAASINTTEEPTIYSASEGRRFLLNIRKV